MWTTYQSLSEAREAHHQDGGYLLDWSEQDAPMFAVGGSRDELEAQRPDWSDHEMMRFARAGHDEINLKGLTYGDAGE